MMSPLFVRRAALFTLSAAVLNLPLALQAAESAPWPNAKPITWIVGFPPGGTADALTRVAARKLSEKTGQPVVVDNRPGASGALGLQLATKAAADGYTLITLPGPLLYKQQVPEVGKELRAIAMLAQGPMVFVAPSSTKPSTINELLDALRKDPKSWSYATSGAGTSQHLAGELFNSVAGTTMVHIPYKGGAQAIVDVVGGQVPLAVLGAAPVLPFIHSGKLKAYAVTTAFRLDSLPHVPTMQEAGIKGYEATQWFAVGTSAGVADERVNRLNAWLIEIATSPDMKAALQASGNVAGVGSAQRVTGFILEDQQKWKELVKKIKLSID